jgi:hypothetical protein
MARDQSRRRRVDPRAAPCRARPRVADPRHAPGRRDHRRRRGRLRGGARGEGTQARDDSQEPEIPRGRARLRGRRPEPGPRSQRAVAVRGKETRSSRRAPITSKRSTGRSRRSIGSRCSSSTGRGHASRRSTRRSSATSTSLAAACGFEHARPRLVEPSGSNCTRRSPRRSPRRSGRARIATLGRGSSPSRVPTPCERRSRRRARRSRSRCGRRTTCAIGVYRCCIGRGARGPRSRPSSGSASSRSRPTRTRTYCSTIARSTTGACSPRAPETCEGVLYWCWTRDAKSAVSRGI